MPSDVVGFVGFADVGFSDVGFVAGFAVGGSVAGFSVVVFVVGISGVVDGTMVVGFTVLPGAGVVGTPGGVVVLLTPHMNTGTHKGWQRSDSQGNNDI